VTGVQRAPGVFHIRSVPVGLKSRNDAHNFSNAHPYFNKPHVSGLVRLQLKLQIGKFNA
jgi:hypothetical protein